MHGMTDKVVERASLSGVTLKSTGSDARLVSLFNGGTLRRLGLNGIRSHNANSGILVDSPSGTTLTRVDAHNVDADHNAVFSIADTSEVNAFGVSNAGSYGIYGGAITLRAFGMKGDQPPWVSDGAGTIHSKTFDYQADVAKLAKAQGNMAYNNNGARSCGVGPVVCDGTTWKHIYTGATY